MINVNQIVMSTLLRAMSSSQSNGNSLNSSSYNFNSILENTLGSLTSLNTCSTCGHSNSSSLNNLNTLTSSINYNKLNNIDTIQTKKEEIKTQEIKKDKTQSSSEVNQIITNTSDNKMDKAIELLKKQVGKKYVWGATGPDSFDCSGLVRYIYKEALGKEIPRVSYDQSKFGKAINKEDLQVGDLVFFDTMNKGRVSHVGMYIGNNEFIHASNSRDGVKKSTLTGYYERTYKGARRP